MRIAMIGHKRYGSREGGVEVVVTELSRRMAAGGHKVTCYDRGGADIMTGDSGGGDRTVDGVRVMPVRTIDTRGLAALSSSFFATIKAIQQRPDVIHYHAEGPCVPLRLAHWAGIRTVATVHGLDWQRAKWGKLARSYIKMGERTAARCADEIIVLSESAGDYFRREYGRETALIANAVEPEEPRPASLIKSMWGLDEGSYVLFLGRIVPEKGLHYLVEAYRQLHGGKRLIVAGGSSDTSEYLDELRRLAEGDDRILFVGFVSGELLEELYSNAYCFVLPSDTEGMPISLLEAMAHGRCCITSDIPECADVLAGTGLTFPKGSVGGLRDVLARLLAEPRQAEEMGEAARTRVLSTYNWNSVVSRTLALYVGSK